MLTAVPQPIPGKQVPTPPRPPAEAAWAHQPLVETTVTYNRADGRASTSVKTAYGVHLVDTYGDEVVVDERAFKKLDATSLLDAVEGASKLASKYRTTLPAGGVNPLEQAAAAAVAVLRAADGAYYLTTLGTDIRTLDVSDQDGRRKEYAIGGFASVDTALESMTVKDVKALHPDVKAVVGPYSWVNFTDEQVDPQLAT